MNGFNVGDKVKLLYGAYGYAPGLPRVTLEAGAVCEIVAVTYGAFVVDDGWIRATVPPDAIEAVEVQS